MSTTTAALSRHMEFSDGSSSKFWKIQLDGNSHTVTFGRIGTAGQTQTKEFDSEDAARKAYDKLVAEKTKKGYVDAAGSGDGASAATAPAAAKPAAKAPAKPKAVKKAAKVEVDDKEDEEASEEEPAGAAPAKTASQPAKQAAPKIQVDLSIERSIDLQPRDWYWATFRNLPPLDRSNPPPFDKEQCIKQLGALKTTSYGWETCWGELNLPSVLTREEALFWLAAAIEPRDRQKSMRDFAAWLGTRPIDDRYDLKTFAKLADDRRGISTSPAYVAFANLYSAEEFVEFLLKSKPTRLSHGHIDIETLLARGFVASFVPLLSVAERAELGRRVRAGLDPAYEPATNYDAYPAAHYLAAALGLHDVVYDITSRWADNRFSGESWHDHYSRPQHLVLGLGSPELVAAEWRRLKLKMRSAADVRAFLACTEYSALDCVVDCINAETNKEKCEELLEAFCLVHAPEAAGPMLECKLSSKMPSIARDWLETNVGHAITGLIEIAGGRGKLADAAIEYLRSAKASGHQAAIAAAIKACSNAEAAARVHSDVIEYEAKVYQPCDAKSTPEWLATAINDVGKLKRKSVPVWAEPNRLPPLVVGDHRLNDEQVDLVVQLLAATAATDKHPLLVALRQHATKSSRDEFAWRLFQSWQEDGSPSKEKWAMGAIAHLGEDNCVLRLTPLIRNWPGESQHARAVFGLECLRAIGSGIALMQLAGIAQKLKFKGLKGKAEQFVTDIATERGLTRDELEDRVVPDCGLDENGRREFSFGPRSFSFVLASDLKAMVRDEAGKVRPNLPDPSSKDDQAVAGESVAEWKLLKKQIKDVATIQAGRLEQAMITGRRWNADDFGTLLVRHPLMTHLAQKLIWAGFDAKGQRVTTFRITEERDYASPDDDEVKLTGVATVGVVHPLELSEAERERWGQVLGDYEVVAPFAQLGRPVYALEPAESKEDDLKRMHGMKLVAPTLVFTLEKLNWIRGVAMDAGCFDEHSKQFPAADITAVIGYEGTVGMGYIDPNELLTIQTVNFMAGKRKPSCYEHDAKGRLPLAKVPPIVISEVLADLQVLKSKAK